MKKPNISESAWTADKNDKLNPDRAFGIVRQYPSEFDGEEGLTRSEVIAEVCGGCDSAEADANLMAAAPTMAAALEQVLAALRDLKDVVLKDTLDFCGIPEAEEAVRDALIKAGYTWSNANEPDTDEE